MKKICYSLILFISLFVGVNYASAYTLEDGEVELLKCNYGSSKDTIFVSVIKTSHRIIVDGPSFCGNVTNKIEYTELDEKAGNTDAAALYGCPTVISVTGVGQRTDSATSGILYDSCSISASNTSTLQYYRQSAELGDVVTDPIGPIDPDNPDEPIDPDDPKYEKTCVEFSNLVLNSSGGPMTIALRKKYGNYYYKITGYGVDTGDIFLTSTATFTSGVEKITFNIDPALAEDFKTYLDDSNEDYCPSISDYYACRVENDDGTIDYTLQAGECTGLLDTKTYENLLGDLKSPLSDLAPEALSYSGLTLGGKPITLKDDITSRDTICKEGSCVEPEYQTIQALKNIKAHCNNVRNELEAYYGGVEKDCVAFDEFYDKLVENGIIPSLVEGCDFLSEELSDKLNLILNIIKILGPVLAILLGMMDFVKVIAGGDAEKGMKDAWKRFQTRLIAAFILFLIPVLLSMLLNLFIGDEVDDNPFCDLLENSTGTNTSTTEKYVTSFRSNIDYTDAAITVSSDNAGSTYTCNFKISKNDNSYEMTLNEQSSECITKNKVKCQLVGSTAHLENKEYVCDIYSYGM